jgi:hypothetical protein
MVRAIIQTIQVSSALSQFSFNLPVDLVQLLFTYNTPSHRRLVRNHNHFEAMGLEQTNRLRHLGQEFNLIQASNVTDITY